MAKQGKAPRAPEAQADALRAEVRRLRAELAQLKDEHETVRDAQGELEASRSRYADLYDFAPIGYLTLDPRGIMGDVNLAATAMLGQDRFDIEGRPLLVFVAKEDRRKLLKHLSRCRKGETSVVTELTLAPISGAPAPRIVLLTSDARTDDAGRRHLRTALIDITAQRQAEGNLSKAMDGLEEQVTERTADLETVVRKLQDEVARRTIAEDALRQRSDMLDAFFQHAVSPLVILGPDFNFIRVNESFARACRKNADDFPGRSYFTLFPDAENKAVFENVVRTREPFHAFAEPFTFPDHPESDRAYWNWALTPLLNDEGKVEYLVLTLEDVTQRALAHQKDRDASLYTRGLIETSPDPLVTISCEGKITDVNEATELATGRPREHLIGSDFSDYFTEPAKAREGYQAVLEVGLVRDYPLTIRHATGRQMHVLYNAAVYKNAAGKVQGVFAVARDVTARMKAQRRQDATTALLELFAKKTSRKEYLDAAVEVIRDWTGCRCVGIRIVEENQKIPYASHVGFPRKFMESENDLSLKTDACICMRVVMGAPQEREARAMTPAGSLCLNDSMNFLKSIPELEKLRYRGYCMKSGFATVAVLPLRYGQTNIGAIHIADERKDMLPPESLEFLESMAPLIAEAVHRFNTEAELATHRQNLEQLVERRTSELTKTADELERSNYELKQFAYVASHDLQEPLRMITGFMGIVSDRYESLIDEKGKQYIHYAVDGANRMSQLIHDLLAYSRVQTRPQELADIDMNIVLDRAMTNCLVSIRESAAKVTRDALPTVRGDQTQLTQLLQNLIANALKFRRPGEPPEIHVGSRKDGEEWIFWVQDNGIGIPPAQAERIFQIFQRLHTADKYPGTGIGLAICKKVVERHGGRIWVESEKGRGAKFMFTIPSHGGEP